MSLRSRIEKLERSLGQRSESSPMPLLTRHEMAVKFAILVKRARDNRKRSNGSRKPPAPTQPMTEEQRINYERFIRIQLELADEIEAAGKLPEVIASLRAKGVDV